MFSRSKDDGMERVDKEFHKFLKDNYKSNEGHMQLVKVKLTEYLDTMNRKYAAFEETVMDRLNQMEGQVLHFILHRPPRTNDMPMHGHGVTSSPAYLQVIELLRKEAEKRNKKAKKK